VKKGGTRFRGIMLSRNVLSVSEPRHEDQYHEQHLLTPPLSQALAARFSPSEPDVNKPRGSHIKVVGHRSRGGYPTMKFSIEGLAASEMNRDSRPTCHSPGPSVKKL
jgi:hypothetical protein